MKVRGWQRIGIVVSVIWFVGFGWFLWGKTIEDIVSPYSDALKHCARLLEIDNDALRDITDPGQASKQLGDNFAKLHRCEADAHQQWESERPDYRMAAAVVVGMDIVSIILGWLIVWGCVALVKWVRRGFPRHLI